MQKDVALAHAKTWRTQAAEFEREAVVGDGYSEVAFLLRRAATTVEMAAGYIPPPEAPTLPEPLEGELRGD